MTATRHDTTQRAERFFPPDFMWGTATSAYQIEGAAEDDGRGPSIWDVFSRRPGAVLNGDTGDVAVDHYHLFKQDIALMKAIGINAYRFSISWPRVQPDGSSTANQKGLDFYRRLVDELLNNGITPVVTLYHWDLPQRLEDEGGWPNREIADRFADYALLTAEALSDRVAHWITLNEPWCSAFLGYAAGQHAPGKTDEKTAIRAVHGLLLGHGRAVEAIRTVAPEAAIGVTLNLCPIAPATEEPPDLGAAKLIDGLQNRLFLDPVLTGTYPHDILEHFSKLCDLSFLRDEDLGVIAAPIDALGVNYYHGHTVRAGSAPAGPSPWVGAQHVEFVPLGGPRTAMGWDIQPDGLIELLHRLDQDYQRIPLYITENGAAFHDYVDPNGTINDAERVRFLDDHIGSVHQALTEGVDVKGYFAWSMLDNFEWAWGYSKRFGIVHVDFPTQTRTMKASAYWYRDVIRAHRAHYTRKGLTASIGKSDGHRVQPTLEEVAELAGVSRATVSRVINASPRVSENTRVAVENAIRQLGYVPNRAARSLVTRRTDTIALVVHEPPARFFTDPFFAGIVEGVTQCLSNTEFQLLLSITHGTEQSDRFEKYMVNGHADGVLVVSFPVHDPIVEKLLAASVPLVLSGRPGRDLTVSYVDANNRGGANAAVSHLLSSGRSRIATIAGPKDMAAGLDRLEGYRDALEAAGSAIDDSLVDEGDFSQPSGVAAMNRLLDRRPDLDAVFAASDLMAAGAMRALAERGKKVPDDVAVVGFDDSETAVLATPPLSTVRQPITDMGRQMATMLVDQIRSGDRSPKRVVADTELILRAST